MSSLPNLLLRDLLLVRFHLDIGPPPKWLCEASLTRELLQDQMATNGPIILDGDVQDLNMVKLKA